MKIKLFTLVILLFLIVKIQAQSEFTAIKAGHVYSISIPDYMIKMVDLNDVATYQFGSEVKNGYGFVIEDSKEELLMYELKYENVTEFYDGFIKDFLVDLPKRKVSSTKTFSTEGVSYLQSEASYYDEEAEDTYYYYITIVETKTHFYKVVCWTNADNKDKLKDDLFKIGSSVKEIE
jgi:hypothetical protein